MARRVALATATASVDLDDDMAPLLAALADRGVAAEPVVWDDGGVDWAAFDLVVVRSTWDYTGRRDDFLAWADRVAAVTTLANPVPVLRWNTDKRYLRDLAAAGVPVVPTTWFEPGDAVTIRIGADRPATGQLEGAAVWRRADGSSPTQGDIVVKPTVSSGARDTSRHGADDLDGAEAAARRLLDAGRGAMVQPYLEGVERDGETALLFFSGTFSHAIRKAALLTGDTALVRGLYAEETITPRTPSAAELEAAEAVLAALPAELGPLLYARVDLVPGDGGPVLMELELTEPSLFLPTSDGAPARFAEAISRDSGS